MRCAAPRTRCWVPWAFLALLAWTPERVHPGPPVFLRLRIEREGLNLRLSGEQDVLLSWFGVEGSFDETSSEVELQIVADGARETLVRSWLAVDGEGVEFDEVEVRAEGPEGALSRTYGEPTLSVEMRTAWDELPQRVELIWRNFEGAISEQDQRVYLPAVIRGDGSFRNVELTPDEPQFTWRASSISAPEGRATVVPEFVLDPRLLGRPTWPVSPWTLGLLLVSAVGALASRGRIRRVRGFVVLGLCSPLVWGLGVREVSVPFGVPETPPNGDALEVFDLLHRGVYGAFRCEGEDEIYAALQPFVHARLLDELYVQIYGDLVLEEQGGARSIVDRVEVLEERVLPSEGDDGEAPSFRVERIWRAHGSVSHWGHRHDRVVRIRGRYKVTHDGVSWKLSGQEVLEHERLTAEDASSVLPQFETR